MKRPDPKRELTEVDRVFSALAHRSRRHILLVIHHHGGRMTAGEVASRFSCSWPTTTRHLRRLEEADLLLVPKRRSRTHLPAPCFLHAKSRETVAAVV